jgi:hypothetical protein
LLNGLEFKSTEYGIELSETPETTQTKQAKKPTKKGKGTAQKPSNDCVATDVVQISTCINNCWTKLRKYYTLTDQSPVYAAAVVLNPEHKLDYFKSNWEEFPDWVQQTERNVEDLWLTMYKDSANSVEVDTRGEKASGSRLLPQKQKDPSDFEQWVSRHKVKPKGPKRDEYEQYLQADHYLDCESEDSQSKKAVDLCAFWASCETQYPSLARMAFDMLSIPAMSSECERMFSSTKILLSDRRARMKEDIIEASECLRSWFRSGQCSQSM